MSTLAIVLIVIGALIVLGLLWLMAAFNGLVRLRNQVKNAWAQIDVQLKRRWDLIPNLVETVQSASGQGVAKQAEAESMLTAALRQLMVVVEAYPTLKANENFLGLQEELTSTENRIGFARQFYNDSVQNFNNRTQMFPTNIVAGMFGFKAAEFFELKEVEQREAPKVQF